MNYSTYLSPFSTRYGSEPMRHIWSEKNKRILWRSVWIEIAKTQKEAGIISQDELDDLISHRMTIDIPRSKEIEKEIYHELMAEIATFREQCPIGGGKIHVGATSSDILDNTTVRQIHQSLKMIKKSLRTLLALFSQKIVEYESLVCMGYTHLQPAEPTTLGYRLSFYAQDLLMDLEFIEKMEPLIKGKGIRGAVGTSASYAHLLRNTTMSPIEFENKIMKEIHIEAVCVSNQTYPRKIDWYIVTALSGIAQSLHKFAFDYRIMQSPGFGEWEEKRTQNRVGSSAMPFKKNPDKAEKVCSLSRYVSSLLSLSWSNPANSLLERTLDDSASQRIFLPESFLAVDECIMVCTQLLKNLIVSAEAVKNNLEKYGSFSAAEPLMMALVQKGADRQIVHEILKEHAMKAWEESKISGSHSFFDRILQDKRLTIFVPADEFKHYCDISHYTGVALIRTQNLIDILRKRGIQ